MGFFQIHKDEDATSGWCGPWKLLLEALKVFHPAWWKERERIGALEWSGVAEVDFLASQLVALAAALWFLEHPNRDEDWPWPVADAARSVCTDANLLRGWKISAWIDDGSPLLLPWKRILPACFLHLLPYVLLHVLLDWAEILVEQDQDQASVYIPAL